MLGDRDPTIAKKELDLKAEGRKFVLEAEQKRQLMQVVKEDCLFFEQHCVIDYSLLIGVHQKQDPAEAQRKDCSPLAGSMAVKSSSAACHSVSIFAQTIGFLFGDKGKGVERGVLHGHHRPSDRIHVFGVRELVEQGRRRSTSLSRASMGRR
ncbi:MAG: hypothetical protein P4M11_14315 [Candidatus Pacebacteria bacterium]|nr:hypothetical protein [Candidatus Paceibacterota bacterium]